MNLGENHSARRRGILFVTDLGFALPTIASALEVRKKVPIDAADIRIVTTAIPGDTVQRLRDFLEPYGIHTDVLDPACYSAFDHRLFNKTHVPISSIGRFFMMDAVPNIYDRILYLDGDTWPTGDPLQLLEAELPQGYIGAAEDRNYFRRDELGPVGRKTRAYFSNLGIDGNAGYFNAGVLLADAPTWRSLCAEAFEFFLKNTARCAYHDQSALNAVAEKRRVRLAPQWNFANVYLEWKLKYTRPPQILHFVGGEKPWQIPFHPYYKTYAALFASLTHLGLTFEQRSPENLQALARRARLRTMRDFIFVQRRFRYQRTFDCLVQTAKIQ
ncbi:MAG TPA: glycosyltransferase [Acidocella sp.]|jgi:lipopolysaccharide biosynthesis glycosyltransferase|nr:glycosyltransferase [Acidocella sp.]